jgi:hypothetical protein
MVERNINLFKLNIDVLCSFQTSVFQPVFKLNKS